MKINSRIWTIWCVLCLFNPWLGGSVNTFDRHPTKTKYIEKSIPAIRENARHFTGVDLLWEQINIGSQSQYKVKQEFDLMQQLPL